MADTTRTATSPGAGSLRDLVIGFVVGTVGAAVAQKTGSPELGDAAGQAAGQASDVLVGTATAVILAVVTYGRKRLFDALAARS